MPQMSQNTTAGHVTPARKGTLGTAAGKTTATHGKWHQTNTIDPLAIEV